MKYNKSEIMNAAWTIRRRTGCTMSIALKQSWSAAKASTRVFSIEAVLAEENTTEKCAARLAAIKAREARYEALISECRAHGIPARKGWKASTMQQKLAEVAA